MRSSRGSHVPTLSRKVMERNRRILTKDLLSKLASQINPSPSAPKWTSNQLLDDAAAHVKQLQQKVEMLKKRKHLLEGSCSSSSSSCAGETAEGLTGPKSPIFSVRDLDSGVEVRLSACTLNHDQKFILSRVVDALEEESAPVVAVSYSRGDDRMMNYVIYSQAICPRIGIDSSRVHERLKMLITENNGAAMKVHYVP